MQESGYIRGLQLLASNISFDLLIKYLFLSNFMAMTGLTEIISFCALFRQ